MTISRRELLRLGALSLGAGGVLAACGPQAGVEDSPNVPSLEIGRAHV